MTPRKTSRATCFYAISRFLAVVFLSISLPIAQTASACTTFRVETEGGGQIIGRAMELALPLDSQVMIVPRGFQMSATNPDLKSGTRWEVKYGFVGINTLGVDISTDGMNEKGLSIGTLYIPGYVKYEPFPSDGSPAISNLELSNWVLSQFTNVDEVKASLKKIKVYGLALPPAGPQPLHWAVHDAKGGSIVIEYINGQLHVYDNPIGVLTNAPNFEWHMSNLRSHVNLTNINVDELKLGKVTVPAIGQGTGMVGLPGDYTPPSRFLRAVALSHTAVPPKSADEGVNLAFHILNSVDIILGTVAERSPKDPNEFIYERSQWSTVYDLNNQEAYFRTYGSLAIKKIDLKRIDFTGNVIKHIPMTTKLETIDVTADAK